VKGEIFCLESQKSVAEELEVLLKRHVFQEISIDRLEVSDNYSRRPGSRDHEYFRSFLKLFKASMIRVDDFAIVVTDGKGSWYYMGGYYSNEPYLLELFEDSIGAIFPAVAVMDRMVLMPYDVGDAFAKSRVFPWFVKPRDLGGVVLADFRHADSVTEAIRQVAVQIKNDVAKLCKRHMHLRKLQAPDFIELADLLSVNRRYLELHRAEIVPPSARLSSQIISGPVRMDVSSKVVLEVRYESKDPLPFVIVNVNAPTGTLSAPVAAALSFSGRRAAHRIEFDVVPKTRPFCPLEVLFTIDECHTTSAPFPLPMMLDVEA